MFTVVPDQSGLGNIAALSGIDRVEMAHAFAVLGVLAIGEVYNVVHRESASRLPRCASWATPSPLDWCRTTKGACRPWHRSRAPSHRLAPRPPAAHRPIRPTAGEDHWPCRIQFSTHLVVFPEAPYQSFCRRRSGPALSERECARAIHRDRLPVMMKIMSPFIDCRRGVRQVVRIARRVLPSCRASRRCRRSLCR